MREFYANSHDLDREMGHSFEAKDMKEAVWVAQQMGWTLIGEYTEDNAEIEAAIELRIMEPSVH